MSQVLDLDKFLPEEKILKLGGKEFNLTLIPAELTLRFYDLIPIMERLEKDKTINNNDYDIILKLIFDILKLSNEIDFDWLKKQLNIERFNRIITYIFNALFDTSKKNEAEEVG
jgi:hypothetical protein